MCVCVCCHPIYLDVRLRRTSRGHIGGRSHRISPPSSGGACLDFYPENDSAVPFPRRPRRRILCSHEFIVLHLLGLFLFLFFQVITGSFSWLILFKKNLNASKPSEHPPQVEKCLKGLGGNIGCRDKASAWYQKGCCCVVFFTLTDRASTIPNNTRGCQSGTWSAGQKKKSEEHLPSSNESKEKHKQKGSPM